MRTFLILLASVVLAQPVLAQEMPAEYAAVLKTLARQGDYKDGVLRVNIPRNDVNVSVDGVATPTPFGFGGWIALTKGDHGEVMMGDLVLTEEEVNPVMSAVLDNGLNVTALHNHFFYETPRIFYMHVHGHGTSGDIATRIAPALALIGKTPSHGSITAASGKPIDGKLDVVRLAKIVGYEGEQSGVVYKITIGRPDIPLKDMGATINARMGLNTWAAFYGSDADAVVAGDVAMRAEEVTPVLKALRSNGIEIVAIHHHMTGTEPTVYFLHYWGRGPAQRLATAVRAAVDQTGHTSSPGR
ncbi:MAG TPA: DUF1259 domain-containing protein [Vicinamibacterales bacterium]